MLDAVREHLTVNEGSTVCVPVLAHLVTQSSIMLNQNVADDLDALIEDLNADPFSDTQIRELVSNINTEENSMTLKSSSSSSALSASSAPSSKSPKTPPSTVTGPASVVQQQVQGSEENASDCSSLRQHTATCVAAFCLNIDARQWLAQSLPQLMQSCMTVLSDPTKDSDTKSAAALDACFYIRLMPVCVPPMDIFAQLCTLHSQLVESRIHSQGKPFVGMELCCVQVASQIVKTLGNNLKSSSASVGMESNIDVVVGNFAHIVSSVRSACDTQISPSPFPVMIGSCTLLLQSLSAIPLRTEASRLFKSELVSIFTASLLPSLNLLPIEVHALLVCSADLVIPEISNGIATELYTLSMAICNSPTAIDMLMEVVHINTLNRLCACLDALAKYHSTSTPEERQRFIQSVLPLQECLGPLITACLSALSHTLSVINTGSLAPASIVSKYHSLISICSLILSLVCGLQRSLGKKNFGATSLQTFDACVGLLSSGLAAPVMSSISGIHFIKQMIRLSDSIAQTSSATVSTAQYQVGLTEKLLTFICTYLTDTQICAELLQETIKAGTVAIGCYWNNKNKSDDTAPQSPPACLPIALLLTQLFVGSMDASIPPQDAATAIEGINQLLEMHNLFSVHWFQVGGCWMSILSACIRTLLLTAHPQQFDALVLMLIALQKSDLSKNSDGNLSSGFWLILGTETFRLATDLNINETAMVYLNDMFAKYPNGVGLEMHLYLDLVIHPLVADLAKAKT